MASFRKIRSILLQSFDNGDISEDKLLLYDVNTFKNADVPYESSLTKPSDMGHIRSKYGNGMA